MKKTRLLFILHFIVLSMIAVSCQREPLYDEVGNLSMEIAIDYNIKHTPDVPEPEMMFVGLYDPQTGKLVQTEYTGPNGGEIFAAPGYYDFLVYNFDTEATLIRNNNNINTAEAYTGNVPTRIAQAYKAILHKIKEKRQAPSRVEEYESQQIINEPDHLFAGVDNNQLVPVRGNTGELFVIKTEATTLLETYSLSIGPVQGIDYIASAEAFITGQVQSKLIASREITGEPVTLYVPIAMDKKSRSETLNTTFNTFGKYPEADNKVYLVVKITDIGGNVTILENDITEQFDSPDNTDNEIVIEQNIDIIPTQGGLAPAITIWQDCVIEIPM